MLSNRTLERVSVSYRRGYQDGYASREKAVPDTGISAIHDDTIGGKIKPFADFDYTQGYSAGANDARCDFALASRVRNSEDK